MYYRMSTKLSAVVLSVLKHLGLYSSVVMPVSYHVGTLTVRLSFAAEEHLYHHLRVRYL